MNAAFGRLLSFRISVYLDVDPMNILDPIRLFGFVGNSGSPGYTWNIKITMIDCKLNSELQGC